MAETFRNPVANNPINPRFPQTLGAKLVGIEHVSEQRSGRDIEGLYDLAEDFSGVIKRVAIGDGLELDESAVAG